jgi:putative hydrolase of the HAD superfamily
VRADRAPCGRSWGDPSASADWAVALVGPVPPPTLGVVPLLLLDLDDTLLDRTAAYARWARAFAAELGAGPGVAAWLVELDAGGHASREGVAAAIAGRFGAAAGSDLVDRIRRGLVEHIDPDPAVPPALAAARDAGWTPVVVTNGATRQQERKLHATGLIDLVAGWVISEAAGTGKPDPRIFREAARRVGQDLDGAWMVGDSAVADIGGAHRLGLRSAWVRRSRTWPITEYAPTLAAETGPEAIRAILAYL